MKYNFSVVECPSNPILVVVLVIAWIWFGCTISTKGMVTSSFYRELQKLTSQNSSDMLITVGDPDCTATSDSGPSSDLLYASLLCEEQHNSSESEEEAKGRYVFSWGGEGWGILVFFFQKSVGPPSRFNKKTPDPPPLGD